MKYKRIWIIEVSVIIILIISIIFTLRSKDNEKVIEKVNKEEVVVRSNKSDGLLYKEITQLYSKTTGSKINVVITNTSNNTYYLDGFDLIVKDETGKVIDTIIAHKYIDLNSNESFKYFLKSDKDIVTNKNYTIEFIPHKQS